MDGPGRFAGVSAVSLPDDRLRRPLVMGVCSGGRPCSRSRPLRHHQPLLPSNSHRRMLVIGQRLDCCASDVACATRPSSERRRIPGGPDMYSSTAGLILSLIIAGLVLISSWVILFNYASNENSGRLGPSYAIGAGAASFAVVFSVSNLALQPHAINASQVTKELASGFLALRVISVIAAATFARLMLAAREEEKFVIDMSLITGDREKDSKLLDEEKKRQANWPVGQIASQATVLLLVLCLLLALQALRRDSLAIALLNWSFAFSSDDFFMAASYRVERGVLPPLFDKTLIWIWRITTLVLFCWVAFQQFRWWAIMIIVPVVFFLFLPKLASLLKEMFVSLGSMVAPMHCGELPDDDEP
jgi:hypothetical protein